MLIFMYVTVETSRKNRYVLLKILGNWISTSYTDRLRTAWPGRKHGSPVMAATSGVRPVRYIPTLLIEKQTHATQNGPVKYNQVIELAETKMQCNCWFDIYFLGSMFLICIGIQCMCCYSYYLLMLRISSVRSCWGCLDHWMNFVTWTDSHVNIKRGRLFHIYKTRLKFSWFSTFHIGVNNLLESDISMEQITNLFQLMNYLHRIHKIWIKQFTRKLTSWAYIYIDISHFSQYIS